ncbi:MAG: hypothetical protein IPI39_22830 [Candidatus Obscuribacter sp.]|nr:hypothetical protein [Candidatus Obscuribacter sp.]
MADNSKRSGRLIGTALFAIWPTLFSFAYNVLMMLTKQITVGDVFTSTLACWLIFWFISYAVMDITDGMREAANRPRERDTDQNNTGNDPNAGGNTVDKTAGKSDGAGDSNQDNKR